MIPPDHIRIHRIRWALAFLVVAVPATVLLGLGPAAADTPRPTYSHVAALYDVVAARETVSINNSAFRPSNLTVRVGDTVMWVNQGSGPHSVRTTQAPAQFASGILQKGQSFSHTFTTAGTYNYGCTVDPSMGGTVTAR